MKMDVVGGHLKAAVTLVMERKDDEPRLWWLGAGTTEAGRQAVDWVMAPKDLRVGGQRAARIVGSAAMIAAGIVQYPGWGLGLLMTAWPCGALWVCLQAGLTAPVPETTSEEDEADTATAPVVLTKTPVSEETVPQPPNEPPLRTITVPKTYDVFNEASWSPPPQSPTAPF
jgi:hypothetical protein